MACATAVSYTHLARCILYSVDFQEIEECQAAGEWEKSGKILGEAAESLQKAGADFIVICTNTMHKVVPQIQSKIHIPILHIAEAAEDRENGPCGTFGNEIYHDSGFLQGKTGRVRRGGAHSGGVGDRNREPDVYKRQVRLRPRVCQTAPIPRIIPFILSGRRRR